MKKYQFIFCVLVVAALINCGDSQDPTNPTGETDTATDTIPPGPPNIPPVLFDHPDTSTTVGSTIYFWPVAYDLDDDSLTYDGFVNATWSDFKRGTVPVYRFIDEFNVLEFKPQAYDRPSRRVYLMVYDGRGGADTTRFTVNVQ